MDIKTTIEQNLSILDGITSDEYPELFRIKEKTSVFLHLIGIMEHMRQQYAMPVWPKRNPRFFFFAQNYCMDWCKNELGIGGSPVSWQSHKVFLYDLGLIKVFSVIGPNPDDEILDKAWTEAQTKHYRSITFWSVPVYSDAVLARAESIARIYREAHANLSHLRKADIIRIRGIKRAGQIYKADADRVISNEERTIESYMHEVLDERVSKNGYATVQQIEEGVDNLCRERLGFSLYHDLDDLPDEDSIVIEAQANNHWKYRVAFYHILKQKRQLFHSMHYRFGPISKRNTERYHIPEDIKCWVITAED